MARSTTDTALERADFQVEVSKRGLRYGHAMLDEVEAIFDIPDGGPMRDGAVAARGAEDWDSYLTALKELELPIAMPPRSKETHVIAGTELCEFVLGASLLLGEAEVERELLAQPEANTASEEDYDFDEVDQNEVFKSSTMYNPHEVPTRTEITLADRRQVAADLLLDVQNAMDSLRILSDSDRRWIERSLKKVWATTSQSKQEVSVNVNLIRKMHQFVEGMLESASRGTLERLTAQISQLFIQSDADPDSLERRVRRVLSEARPEPEP